MKTFDTFKLSQAVNVYDNIVHHFVFKTIKMVVNENKKETITWKVMAGTNVTVASNLSSEEEANSIRDSFNANILPLHERAMNDLSNALNQALEELK